MKITSQNCFTFKRFRIYQAGSAMKVGTDGVLLGAWASLDGSETNILDIGTGTGLIALMAAQRTVSAHIDAVEIDEQSAFQARENVRESPWNDRVGVHHTCVQEFANHTENRYDRIISNPPFFVDSLKAPDAGRSTARHTDELSLDDLLSCVVRLLHSNGLFSVIYPVNEAAVFEEKAQKRGLLPCRKTRVRGNPDAPVKRVLTEFSFQMKPVAENELVIESSRHQYTDEYKALTRDFYLKF